MAVNGLTKLGNVMKNRSYPLSVLALGLLGLIIMVYGILAWHSKTDPSAYAAFVAPIVTTLLGLAVISRQIDQVKDKANDVKDSADKIEHQTNGYLTERLDNMKADLMDHVENVVKEHTTNG